MGELRISDEPGSLAGWPAPGIEPQEFVRRVALDWLPAIYPLWGWQVLHASAAVEDASGRVVAFSGEAGAGKSTFGYALGRRDGWRQFVDDALPFERQEDQIVLRELPNEVRLRPPSAEHFGEVPYSCRPLPWPEESLELAGIFFLSPSDAGAQRAQVRRMPGSEAYRRLLEQSFALSLADPRVRAGLMEDYLLLTAEVPVWAVDYTRDFSSLDGILDQLLEHASHSTATPE